MKKLFVLPILLISNGAWADATPFAVAMANVRANCAGISDAMSHLKNMAGINTAVSAVGTAAGGVALGTGIAKIRNDKISAVAQTMIDEYAKKTSNPTRWVWSDTELKELQAASRKGLEEGLAQNENYKKLTAEQQAAQKQEWEIAGLEAGKAQADKKSETLGNVRTGTMATSAATNIAGAVIAGTNKIDEDLATRIGACIGSVVALSDARFQARVDGSATPEQLSHADQIVSACSKYETVDMMKINKRATGGMVASSIGAATGISGTVTSAMANNTDVRKGDAEKEKNLNAASNVLAGVTTAASATATIFNATQIAAIKDMSTVADECEGAIK